MKIENKHLWSLTKRYRVIRKPQFKYILRVQDEILSALRDFLRNEGFIEILAPIISPVTDPGIRGAKQVSIDYYGAQFKVMSSMILYKQMAVAFLEILICSILKAMEKRFPEAKENTLTRVYCGVCE